MAFNAKEMIKVTNTLEDVVLALRVTDHTTPEILQVIERIARYEMINAPSNLFPKICDNGDTAITWVAGATRIDNNTLNNLAKIEESIHDLITELLLKPQVYECKCEFTAERVIKNAHSECLEVARLMKVELGLSNYDLNLKINVLGASVGIRYILTWSHPV